MRTLVLASLLILCLVCPHGARADSLAEFDRARIAYDAQRFDEAASQLEALLANADPDAPGSAIVLESHKYLAAAYLFLDRRTAAERQFELLLRADPTYELDPGRFPQDVLSVFDDVRERLARQRAREPVERPDDLRLSTPTFASRTVEIANHRIIAMLPFGIGQFRNGHRSLGIAFAVSESLLTIPVITTYLIHFRLSYVDRVADPVAYERTERRTNITNWTSIGLLTGVALAGILDAQIRYRPTRTVERVDRPTADRRPQNPIPVSTLRIGFARMTYRLTF